MFYQTPRHEGQSFKSGVIAPSMLEQAAQEISEAFEADIFFSKSFQCLERRICKVMFSLPWIHRTWDFRPCGAGIRAATRFLDRLVRSL